MTARHSRHATPGGHVAAFGSRPYRSGEATRALDSIVDGLRTLGRYAGAPEETVTSSTDFAALVRDAEAGMPRFVGRQRRTTYDALFVAVGQRCRSLLERMTRPAELAHVTDRVVARALEMEADVVTAGPATTLLRMAVAAELSAGSDPRPATAAAANPLRGVLDLYAMGAFIASTPQQTVRLHSDGGAVPLEWTGNLFSQSAAGRLRPAEGVHLAS